MLTSRGLYLALAAVCLSLAFASAAPAAGPATVTVRIEGLTETKLSPTSVTTTTEPVVNDGNPAHACEGTTALGALQLATAGNWGGYWYAKTSEYFINGIEGEPHVYESGVRSYYWSFWLNDTFEENGPCGVQLQAGDRVLFFPICDEACPAGAEPTPLEIEAPATANVGEQVSVTVRQYNAKGVPSPAVGAHIAWSAGASATTESQGHGALSFGAVGAYQLNASGAESGLPAVRTETTICVHNGNDGTCGTTAPTPASTTPASSGILPTKSHAAPRAIAASITGLLDGHRYARKDGPQVLNGKVVAPASVTSISLRLRRTYHGRCWAYSGVRGLLVRVRCRQGGFFQIASGGTSFSYLLPYRLPRGRYVLDLEATDAAGSHTTLARGTSRFVFYVG